MVKQISIDKETYEKLEARAKELGLTVDEYVTKIVSEKRKASEKEGYVEVKVKVPRVLMRLLEGQNYFGKSKETLFSNAIEQAVHIELNELDFEEQDKLLEKYGIEARLIVDMQRGKIPFTA